MHRAFHDLEERQNRISVETKILYVRLLITLLRTLLKVYFNRRTRARWEATNVLLKAICFNMLFDYKLRVENKTQRP